MKVLIGVDDSMESRHAIDVAFGFCGPHAEYTVASVGENRPLFSSAYAGGTFVSATDLTDRFDTARQAARERARQAAESLPNGADVDVDVAVGHPGRALCDLASDLGADAIVIGSHDKNAWERLVNPSTGRYLIDHAPCPVVVVR
jgi:nucleotide-binding universal stress UspA family protein